MRDIQRKVEAMVADCRPFEEIENLIDSVRLSDDQRAALWLLAWAEQDADTRRRVARDALEYSSD
jgi:hypothetical protein